jgi:PAS domain S-box-containing protein
MVVTGTYNPHLVALSILVAAFASYTALDLGGRVAATRGVAPRVWLVAAAIAMGGGIWSMHFIAMLAFNIPIPMSYDIGLTTLSLVVAIFVTGAGFYFINRQSAPPLSLVFSGIFMGLGIAAMHYIGMAAMREHAEISYDFLFVALSLVIAIGASTAALWLAFRTTDLGQKLVAAVVMGVAISGMHYSAMRGTTFAVHGPVHEAEGYASLDQTNLALVVAGITFVILTFALIAPLQQENSERRRAEEALRRSEAYLAEAQRLSQTGSFGWTPSIGRIYWSDETFRIFEYERSAMPTVELLLSQRVHPEDIARIRPIVERAVRDGQDFDYEHRLQMPDGRVKHIRVVAHATRIEIGHLGFVGAVMDVTEAKETHDRIRLAQAEREQLEQRLRQAEKMEAVGRLAGGIAHDFNNVLAGVFAYGEMIFEETPEDSPLKRYAKNVLTAATRGRALVEQILAFSRSQLGKRVPVDLTHVVAETLELLRGSLPAEIRLEVSAPKLPLIVIGDATPLHQVVMNLCSNAIQAMSAAGTLHVALEAADLSAERALSHGSLAPGRYVRLTIQDSGSGMDEATLARIFEPFFTTKEIGRGTGLGLSLVYAIVTDAGGAIDVRSALEQGSTFSIYLARTQAAPVSAGEAPPPLPRGNGERVLLVEDEASLLAMTAEVLTRLGYEPVPFSDSHAALAAFQAAPRSFDVVITDDVMPGLTGTALATELRRQRPDLPIILVSGYSGPILTQQALAAGVSELLAKPLQSRQFAATLDRVLHQR